MIVYAVFIGRTFDSQGDLANVFEIMWHKLHLLRSRSYYLKRICDNCINVFQHFGNSLLSKSSDNHLDNLFFKRSMPQREVKYTAKMANSSFDQLLKLYLNMNSR